MPIISNLRQIRSAYHNARQTKEQITASFKLISLGKYMDPFMDWMYGIALTLAILKDISDFVGLGSLPVIGTLITFSVSFIIGMIMFLTGSGMKKRFVKALLKRYGALIIGSLLEMLFGLNFFPIETCMIIIVFYLTLRERMLADMEERIAENEKERNYSSEIEPAYN
jgi:hypothetical protein